MTAKSTALELLQVLRSQGQGVLVNAHVDDGIAVRDAVQEMRRRDVSAVVVLG